jgi:hypothetical protein
MEFTGETDSLPEEAGALSPDAEFALTRRWSEGESNYWSRSQDTPVSFETGEVATDSVRFSYPHPRLVPIRQPTSR